MSLLGPKELCVLQERDYQKGLIQRIHSLLPRSVVLKNDPNYMQGIPDLVVFNGDRYAMLEVKTGPKAPHQPNQDYYVEWFDSQGVFSAFVYPENEEEILDAMERSLQPSRKARVHRSK